MNTAIRTIIAFAAASAVNTFVVAAEGPSSTTADTAPSTLSTFIDVHVLGPGNVTAEAVAEAHRKDLEVQGRYGVSFESYWVDEAAGLVYCLSTAPDAEAVTAAHREAHGLIPQEVHAVTAGE